MSSVPKILIVDLDGTLIKSDMLFETFWSSVSNNLIKTLISIFNLYKGKAYFKKCLAEISNVDIKLLPYNKQVINYINLQKSKGFKIALVTANNADIAIKISDYLNLFDEVHGSSRKINLKGINKANFQNERYGKKNYDYLGNSYYDMQIWRDSNKAIFVNKRGILNNIYRTINPNHLFLEDNDNNLLFSFLEEIRPYQWIKNTLVFVPILAAHQINIPYLTKGIFSFLAFSLVASGVYLINDLLDLDADRCHPKKCKRPLASGRLPLDLGTFSSVLFVILGGILGLKVGIEFFILLLSYFLITLTYSIYIKRKAVIDIFVLTGLYTFRIIGGGLATDLEISFWLLGFSIFIFLSLASVKRQSELVDIEKRGKFRIVGRGYEIDDLQFISQLALTSGLLSTLIIALYINSPNVLSLYQNPEYLWLTCCLLLFWIIRICFITSKGKMHNDPIIFAIKDKLSLMLISVILLFTILAI